MIRCALFTKNLASRFQLQKITLDRQNKLLNLAKKNGCIILIGCLYQILISIERFLKNHYRQKNKHILHTKIQLSNLNNDHKCAAGGHYLYN